MAAPRIGYSPPFSASCDLYRPHRSNAPPSARAPRAASLIAFHYLRYVSFAIRPHRVVDALYSARSLSPSCAGSSAPSLRRIRLHRSLAYATIGSRQSSALQRFAERVLCIGKSVGKLIIVFNANSTDPINAPLKTFNVTRIACDARICLFQGFVFSSFD